MKTVIVEKRGYWDGEYKKYRSTEEQIRQNQQENANQRARDERARNESIPCQDRDNNSDRRENAR